MWPNNKVARNLGYRFGAEIIFWREGLASQHSGHEVFLSRDREIDLVLKLEFDRVMDLSQYRLEMLHQDGEFILYRGLRQSNAETSPPSILALSPVMEHPAPTSIKKIEHELSLKDELDPA